MATQATNPKIEELRSKIKADPKSRLFYQLAEELRKVKAYEEAEQVLKAGLPHHNTYLAAWVSLGRALREQDKHKESIEAFLKALTLDPSNVVAARLMADAYLDLGDKVEAIKKYKLVRALLPVDEELNAIIDKLDDEINPVTIHTADPTTQPPTGGGQSPSAVPDSGGPPSSTQAMETPFAEPEPIPAPAAAEESPFAPVSPFPAEDTFPARPTREQQVAIATADVEPMREAHDESPFEEPAPSFSAAALEVEQPAGVQVQRAPLAAEVAAPWPDEEPAADVFEPSQPLANVTSDNVANTVTMADLYVQQGHLDRAQSIYESILDRDPNNDAVRAKLDALDAMAASKPQPQAMQPLTVDERNAKVDRLEGWLSRLKRAEARRV